MNYQQPLNAIPVGFVPLANTSFDATSDFLYGSASVVGNDPPSSSERYPVCKN
jgi:hypothetical protein